jgi:hypothetical protein
MKYFLILFFSLAFLSSQCSEESEISAFLKQKSLTLSQLSLSFQSELNEQDSPDVSCKFATEPHTPNTSPVIKLFGLDIQCRLNTHKVIITPGARDWEEPNEDITGNSAFDAMSKHQKELLQHKDLLFRAGMYQQLRKEINSHGDFLDLQKIKEIKSSLQKAKEQELSPLIDFCQAILNEEKIDYHAREVEFCKKYLSPAQKALLKLGLYLSN